MIIVKLMGGHSNQLFQYATGRRLAAKHRTDLALDLTWFDNIDASDTPREYEIGAYPLTARIATQADLARVHPPGTVHSVKERLIRKARLSKEVWRYDEKGMGFDPAVLELSDNTYLNGFWQCERYFLDVRPELLRTLEPTKKMDKTNKAYLDRILSCEAISIHVRREDYVENSNANEFHGVTSLEYYKEAFEIISKRLKGKDTELFVFSSDMAWCKKNLKFGVPITFVEGNKDGSDDMRLMKHCKHNILANSSFSFWGAWLNDTPGKIVVAPKIWFLDKKANKETDIIPSGWVRI